MYVTAAGMGAWDQLCNYGWGRGGNMWGLSWDQKGSGHFSSSKSRQGGDGQHRQSPKPVATELLLAPGRCPHTEELLHPVPWGSLGTSRGAQRGTITFFFPLSLHLSPQGTSPPQALSRGSLTGGIHSSDLGSSKTDGEISSPTLEATLGV